jgi:hypothetical protein
MTTRVIIKSTRPNHQAVRVEQLHPSSGESVSPQHTLNDGETVELVVHDGACLHITEVPKSEVPARATELSFGQKAVGASFNPSGDANVANCKDEFAVVIDRMNHLRTYATDPEVKRMAAVAIAIAQSAQMWAVKAITWK